MVEDDSSVDRSETEPEKARENQRPSRPKQIRMQIEEPRSEQERKHEAPQQSRPPQQRPNRGEKSELASHEEVPRGGHSASVDEDLEGSQDASNTSKRKRRGARRERRPERVGGSWIWRGAALVGLVALALGGFGAWSLLRDDDPDEEAQAAEQEARRSEQEQRLLQATEDLERRSEAVARSPEDVADCPDQGVYDASAPDVVAVLVNRDGCLVTQYVSLDGRTVESARIELFDADPNVLSVDVPLLATLDDHSGRQSQPPQWHHHELRAAEWADAGEASPVTVAVIDTGVDSSHSVFSNRVSTVQVRGTDRTHGTMVAGIIAELTGPSISIKSWDASSQCLDGSSGCLDYLPALVELTDSKVHSDVKVINLSLSCPDQQSCIAHFGNQNARYTLRRLYEQGKIVVASAGNDYDQSEDDWPRWPVGWSEVVGVAAHSSDGELTAYTNRGDYVDLSAPSGDCSGYIFDSGTGKGSCGPIRDGLTVPSPGNEFAATAGGTSAAAPMVSAVIAQLWSAFPDVSNGQILDAIYGTASSQPGLRHGHGQIQPVAALDLLSTRMRVGDTTTTVATTTIPTTSTVRSSTTSTAPPSTTAGIVQTPPHVPALSLSRSGDVVTASWDSPYDGGASIEGFRLVWLGSSNPYQDSVWNLSSSDRSFRYRGLPCGIDVLIGIQAYNSVGFSAQASRSVRTEDCRGVPDPEPLSCVVPLVSGFEATARNGGMIFTWAPVPMSVAECAGVGAYIRYEAQLPGRPYGVSGPDPEFALSADALAGVEVGEEVCIEVTAYVAEANGISTGWTSDTATACAPRGCVVPLVSGFEATARNGGMIFTWAPVPMSVAECAGVGAYIRYEAQLPGRPYGVSGPDPEFALSADALAGVEVGEEVCIEVTAYVAEANGISTGWTSDTATACAPRGCVVPLVSGFEATARNGGMIFTWAPVPMSVAECAGVGAYIRYEAQLPGRPYGVSGPDPEFALSADALAGVEVGEEVCIEVTAYVAEANGISTGWTSDTATACAPRA